MARPRKVSDDEVFAAVHRAMQRLAPWEFTLAEIAKEAGVTAGALVQRYGSKQDLLLGLMRAWSGSTRSMLEQVRGSVPSALEAVYTYAEGFAHMSDTPGGMAHHLAWLQQDMANPEMSRFVVESTRETTAVLVEWFTEAIAAGEMSSGAEPRALALATQGMLGGSLIAWGFLKEGKATDWVKRDMETLLEPWTKSA